MNQLNHHCIIVSFVPKAWLTVASRLDPLHCNQIIDSKSDWMDVKST